MRHVIACSSLIDGLDDMLVDFCSGAACLNWYGAVEEGRTDGIQLVKQKMVKPERELKRGEEGREKLWERRRAT